MRINIGESKQTNLELKKHVGAIHSSSKLTLIQRKVANALLYNAYDSLLTQERHSIHIRVLCDLIGYDSKDYKAVKNSLIALISTVIQWNIIDKNKAKPEQENIWNASSIIADASIEGPICSYSYSHNMRRLLYHPEVYGRINMRVQARFKSTYGLALYENCIRYQGIGQTQMFDLGTFRLLMGIEKEEYPVFRDLKRRVIDKAVNEINSYSPIFVKVKFKKQGRVVTALQFLIEQQLKALEIVENKNFESLPQTLGLRLQKDFGFSKTKAEEVIKIYGEDYILNKITLIESSISFQAGKIINLTRYLEHALKKDYQLPKSSMERMHDIKKALEQDLKEKKIKAQFLERYKRFQAQKILELFNTRNNNEKIKIEREFEKYIHNNVYYNTYLKDGLQNILVADKFCAFIKINNPQFLNSIISFEEFCSLEENSNPRL